MTLQLGSGGKGVVRLPSLLAKSPGILQKNWLGDNSTKSGEPMLERDFLNVFGAALPKIGAPKEIPARLKHWAVKSFPK